MIATLSPVASPASRWIHEWTPACPKYPQGATGVLEITSFTKRGPVKHAYSVDAILDGGRVVGWHLENLDNGQEYDIDTEWGPGQWQCDCGSSVFGQRECKHCLAIRHAEGFRP